MTREEAINMLQGMRADNLNLDDAYTKDKYDALGMAIEALEQEPKPDWIPVSERLPEENKEVLICLEWGIDIGSFRDREWHSEWINHYDDGNVIAWMPLPKPYKTKGGER